MATLDIKLSASNSFQFNGALTLHTVPGAWSTRRMQWSSLEQNIIFDLAHVTAIDTAGLAWLIQLTDECQQAKKQLKLQNVPTSLLKLAKISDVEGLLPLQ